MMFPYFNELQTEKTGAINISVQVAVEMRLQQGYM